MNKLTPIQHLAMHAINTLPDSVSARRALLESILGSMKPTESIRLAANRMLHAMDSVDRVQAELFAEFCAPKK